MLSSFMQRYNELYYIVTRFLRILLHGVISLPDATACVLHGVISLPDATACDK